MPASQKIRELGGSTRCMETCDFFFFFFFFFFIKIGYNTVLFISGNVPDFVFTLEKKTKKNRYL